MPYTPPSQSPCTSPTSSRSSSISLHDVTSPSAFSTTVLLNSSNPPRSATYLHKHRRTQISSQSPSSTSQHNNIHHASERSSLHHRNVNTRSNTSIHQSPPPVDNGLSMLPTGAVFSPPDSSQNSSDEDESVMGRVRRRGRNLGNLEEQLKEAIKNIPQRRQPSPDSSSRKSASEIDGENKRGRSHQRSISESSLLNGFGRDSNSESDYEDDGYRIAPPMVRKKSGEVVKSSLKTPNRSRPSSMPSTPTFPKAVHFDAHLEHVRHFLHQEKPSAVSAGSSPVESYDGEREFPFPHEEAFRSREPPFEWEINLPNFPRDLDARKHLPVRVERVCLSNDNKNLIGTVVGG